MNEWSARFIGEAIRAIAKAIVLAALINRAAPSTGYEQALKYLESGN